MEASSIPIKQAKELLEAQVHVINHQFSFISSMSLKCAVQMGLSDIIHKHGMPMSLQDLAASLSIPPTKINFLQRLMRILTHSGYYSEQEIEGDKNEAKGYVLTTPSKLLLKDSPFCLAPLVLSMVDPVIMKPWHCLSDWLQNGDKTKNPFVAENGMALWEYASSAPEWNNNFNEAMASDSHLVANLLINDGEFKGLFQGLDSLVDVGGGSGELTKAIATAYPNLKCTVLDLPHVVDGLKGTNNLSYVAGDIFGTIPSAEAILLKWILHNWSDEGCVKILKQCRKAIANKGSRGKVIIIDIVIDESHQLSKVQETQLFLDMTMMILFNGKERNKNEWKRLLIDAGFNSFKIFPLSGHISLIEIYP